MASFAFTREARRPMTTAISASCSTRPHHDGMRMLASGPSTVVAGLMKSSGSAGRAFFISAA